MNLDEFVSDYVAAAEGPVNAEEVAIAYLDTTLDKEVRNEEFDKEVEKLKPQVEYYL